MAFDNSKHLSNNMNTTTNTHRGTRNDIKPTYNDFSPNSPSENGLLQTSTNIFIFSNGGIVGMIQSFQVTENRNINKLQAVGWEGVVQAVPSNTNGGTLNINRLALYESNMWNALGLTQDGKSYNPLGKKVNETLSGDNWDKDTHTSDTEGSAVSSRKIFKTLKDQRVPLEIQVKTKRMGNVVDYYVETYVDCWLQSYQKSFSVGQITVAETCTMTYADVY